VQIFVSTQGEFYCDANTNSNIYKNKTFSSVKLQSIEKAIDDFQGQKVDGNSYYDIAVYNTTLKLLKVTSRVGNRYFFDDGTDSSMHSRKTLYPKSVDQTKEFADLDLIFKEIRQNEKEIKDLYEAQKIMRKKAEDKLRFLQKVNIC